MFWGLFYFWGVGGFQFVVISIRVVSSVPKCRRINIEASRSTWSGRNDEETVYKKEQSQVNFGTGNEGVSDNVAATLLHCRSFAGGYSRT